MHFNVEWLALRCEKMSVRPHKCKLACCIARGRMARRSRAMPQCDWPRQRHLATRPLYNTSIPHWRSPFPGKRNAFSPNVNRKPPSCIRFPRSGNTFPDNDNSFPHYDNRIPCYFGAGCTIPSFQAKNCLCTGQSGHWVLVRSQAPSRRYRRSLTPRASMDAAIGFDWLSFLDAVNDAPFIRPDFFNNIRT